jgi:hypothetical protein
MKIPTIRAQTKSPYTTFPHKSFLLYGEPKTGKTTAAAQFPNPLVLSVLSESGTGEIEAPIIDIETPADLLDVVKWLRAEPHRYETIILDGLSTFVLDEITRHPARDYRRSVKEATAVLLSALHPFLSLPTIRVLTAHAKRETEELEIERKTLSKVSVFADLPPRLRLFVEGRVDAFGYCYATGNGHSKVWWTPFNSDDPPKPRSIAAGNRLGLPRSTELSFEAIHAAIVKPDSNGHASPLQQLLALRQQEKELLDKSGRAQTPLTPEKIEAMSTEEVSALVRQTESNILDLRAELAGSQR